MQTSNTHNIYSMWQYTGHTRTQFLQIRTLCACGQRSNRDPNQKKNHAEGYGKSTSQYVFICLEGVEFAVEFLLAACILFGSSIVYLFPLTHVVRAVHLSNENNTYWIYSDYRITTIIELSNQRK